MEPKFEPKQYTLEEIAEMEKSRTISDANLLIKGAEYFFDKKGEKKLDATNMQEEYLEYEKILNESKNLSKEENISRIEKLFSSAISKAKEHNNYYKDNNTFNLNYYDNNGVLQKSRTEFKDNGVLVGTIFSDESLSQIPVPKKNTMWVAKDKLASLDSVVSVEVSNSAPI
ncbi:MAG: hypothetical protein A2747_02510 [Candidatus Yonathbacteria bacterium RIFCSPHIGHO2_01_FULL_44_41]|uniref:Uncharacterized protein n=1 Tax=Candidatus Yonathbacteria bacterium RIFCSPHIGHO2_02_FULL_44_14 TaxID=1802724 RepID=A0A1G2S663_9BACT|nr:MAG: hypothetical protein A2747_02510 [Candidatus Yonathbacteria bacterium RIFCSPHIGHO2_01_FULL_44_41]OHA80614.1 MAG: hypothetical protein A3D51_00880 [Candidatus Yonathbacteria bacterium RIFCSPHIGHO2_02_FULL_44_14]OHA82094.1 MAG: hypothetical protein A3B06_01115 [Candidatus Yonathbacteria bacterium RIFCSPLOWO2_01_FULL_43_20]